MEPVVNVQYNRIYCILASSINVTELFTQTVI